MDRVVEILRGAGYRVIGVEGNRIEIVINPLDIGRMPMRLRNVLADHGAIIHEAKHPFDLPCAWVEYDLATLRARLFVVINDSFIR